MRVVDSRRAMSGREQDDARRGGEWASPQTLFRHRITPDDYEAMLEAQDYSCAICRDPSKKLVVDHDHGCCDIAKFGRTCGLCVRGLVCHRCNMLLGFLEGSDPTHLVRALRYIDGHNVRGVGLDGPGGAVDVILRYLSAA